MLPFPDALRTVLDHTPRLEPASVPLPEALGLVLAADVASDVAMPPFDKSAMDGFALLAADLPDAPRTLPIAQNIPAGTLPAGPLLRGSCARIMTGAPLPPEADAVVRVEDTQPGPDPQHVTFLKPAEKGRHICWKAEDVAAGDLVLRASHVIRPPEIALLASCGAAAVRVVRRPTVAVLSTGNEVIPFTQTPAAGQIRDANSPYLAARLRRLAIEARLLGIARDDERDLHEAITDGLHADVLVLSGGVSMGDYDLVPAVLKSLGIELLFDSVAMQPGRPTVFGRRGRTVVFGLPGNPVSVMVASELLLVPALRQMMGHSEVSPRRRAARLTEAVKHRPGRLSHLPAVLAETDCGWTARPLPYHGSAHVHALSQANGLIVLPPDVAFFAPGANPEVIELAL